MIKHKHTMLMHGLLANCNSWQQKKSLTSSIMLMSPEKRLVIFDIEFVSKNLQPTKTISLVISHDVKCKSELFQFMVFSRLY